MHLLYTLLIFIYLINVFLKHLRFIDSDGRSIQYYRDADREFSEGKSIPNRLGEHRFCVHV